MSAAPQGLRREKMKKRDEAFENMFLCKMASKEDGCDEFEGNFGDADMEADDSDDCQECEEQIMDLDEFVEA